MSPPETHDRTDDPTLGSLVHDLATQIPELVRSELRLAQAELAEKGKRAGMGAGMFGAAGILALFGVATLIAAAVLALSLVMAAWLAAVIVGAVLLAGAGVAALQGKSKVSEATPAAPERAIAGLKEDVQTVKGNRP
jgi:uncharacterized membrane protein YqjE